VCRGPGRQVTCTRSTNLIVEVGHARSSRSRNWLAISDELRWYRRLVTGRMRILAVDNEESVLRDFVWMLQTSAPVGEVDGATSGSEALRRLAGVTDRYDAIFTDVQMPDLDGLELARVLGQFASPPAIVFVSAGQEAAVEAFELRALDYLVKPVSRRRLDETLSRLEEIRAIASWSQKYDDEIVSVDSLHGSKRLIARSSILYLRAQGDYVRVVTGEGRFLVRVQLSEIAGRWEAFGFVRVHRQYAVNLRLAREMRPQLNGTATLVFAGDREVPVARRQVGELGRRLHI
jgi:two-component system, LytTR family, response regulator LytT